MTEQIFGDMSEEFDFDDEGMEYIDGPLSGWMRRKRDGAWFAYDCQSIIADRLWHWVLVSAPKKSDDEALALVEATRAKGGAWVSIVEDRRSRTVSTCSLVSIESRAVDPLEGEHS